MYYITKTGEFYENNKFYNYIFHIIDIVSTR